MFSLGTDARPALHFTVLGEPPLKLLRYQQQFSFFEPAKMERSIRFFNLSDDVLSGDLGAVLSTIVREVEQANPAVVVVDSFRSVARAASHRWNATRASGVSPAYRAQPNQLSGDHVSSGRVPRQRDA